MCTCGMVRVVWHTASENIPSQSTELGERTPVSTRMTEFIPERWLEKGRKEDKKFHTDTSAFIPFSLGPMNCAGKNLALLELRAIIATLVRRFEMRLADGFDPQQWEDELHDFFVMEKGKLPVVLTKRKAFA